MEGTGEQCKTHNVGGHEEPDESRDSRPRSVRAWGAFPLGYSTVDISNMVP